MKVLAILVGLGLAVLGVLFFLGKAPKKIIDFERINREEQGRLHIQRLGRNLGIVLFLLSLIFLATGFFQVFRERYFLWSFIGWVALSFLDIWFIGKSRRYYKW